MPRLRWDQESHPFEAGVDRGVLYLESGLGVAWPGLISVDDQADGGDPEAYYHDGEKYLDAVSNEDTMLSIEAFTYPDEFSDYDGYQDILDKQNRKLFGFSYRTQTKDSYKIHLVYNCTAVPTDKTWGTESDQSEPTTFGWSVPAVPVPVPGAKATAHIVVDVDQAAPAVVTQIEAILYGEAEIFTDIIDGGTPQFSSSGVVNGGTPQSSSSEFIDGGTPSVVKYGHARMPTPVEILDIFIRNATFTVIDHGDGTWTATGDDEFVYMTDETSFEINWPLAIYSDRDTYSIRSS